MAHYYRVKTTWSGPQGSPWFNNSYFQESGGTAQQAVTAIGAVWTSLKAHQDSGISFTTDPTVETIEGSTNQLVGLTTTTPVTGTGTSGWDRLPPEVQGLMRLHTGVFYNGRELRGRVFLPGCGEPDNFVGAVLAGTVSDFNAWFATLIADANSIYCVYSRRNLVGQPVTSAAAWTQWAGLRSRRD
jgi:hypothetical protein